MFTTTGAFFAHNLERINGRKYLFPDRPRIAPAFWVTVGTLLVTVATTLSFLAAR